MPKGFFENKLPLAQVMTVDCRKDKPLPEPMMTPFTDAPGPLFTKR